jgi:SAM-dependent methyltransferase
VEYVKCILCDQDKQETILNAEDLRYKTSEEFFTLVRCTVCGLVFINPRPAKDEMAQYYPGEYRPRKTIETLQRERRKKKYSRERNYYFFRNPWYIDFPAGSKVLDIGCGSGELMLLLEQLRCETYGIDVDDITGTYLRDTLNLNVETRDIDNGSPFRDEFFDNVIMRHSLEHFHNPLRVLQEVKRIMKPEGLLIIGVPNLDSVVAKLTGTYWKDLDIPRHLFHFTPVTIDALVRRAGFSLQKISHEMKVSRESLKRKIPSRFLSVLFRSRPVMSAAGITLSLFRRGEWIVVKARKEGPGT